MPLCVCVHVCDCKVEFARVATYLIKILVKMIVCPQGISSLFPSLTLLLLFALLNLVSDCGTKGCSLI